MWSVAELVDRTALEAPLGVATAILRPHGSAADALARATCRCFRPVAASELRQSPFYVVLSPTEIIGLRDEVKAVLQADVPCPMRGHLADPAKVSAAWKAIIMPGWTSARRAGTASGPKVQEVFAGHAPAAIQA